MLQVSVALNTANVKEQVRYFASTLSSNIETKMMRKRVKEMRREMKRIEAIRLFLELVSGLFLKDQPDLPSGEEASLRPA